VVVVKEINTTSLTAKQKAATMDEVLVLNKLNHPNIVKYHDCYMDAVYINIVMEYCNGGDLAGLIKGREGRLMPEDEVMSLFVQVRGTPAWWAFTVVCDHKSRSSDDHMFRMEKHQDTSEMRPAWHSIGRLTSQCAKV
jgi:serine/threonine protein kinase